MEYNELLTLANNCLDGNLVRHGYGGIAYSDILHEFVRSEKGKQQFEAMYDDQQLLALYVVALLPTCGKSSSIDFDVFNFEETILSLCLIPNYKDLLMKLLNGTMLLTDWITNTNSNNNDINIESEWIDEKVVSEKSKGKKKQQTEIKTKLLRLLICLLGPTDLVHLDRLWGGKRFPFLSSKKTELKKYILQFVSAVPAVPVPASSISPPKNNHLLSKHNRTPQKDGGTTKLFSPSMKSPLGKKPRRKSLLAITPPKTKSNRPTTFLQKLFSPSKNDRNKDAQHDHDAATTGSNNTIGNRHKISETVLEKNQEDDSNELHQSFETVYNRDKQLDIDTSFGNGGCDDDNDDDDDDGDKNFRIRSSMIACVGPKVITPTEEPDDYSNWESPTKKTTTTDAAAAAVSKSAHVSSSTSVAALAKSMFAPVAAATSTTAAATTIGNVEDFNVHSPTTCCERERKKNRFAGLLRGRASEYPTLIEGCQQFSDIKKAAREALTYLGYEDLIDVIINKKSQTVLNINGTIYVHIPETSTKKEFKKRNKELKWIDAMVNAASSGSISAEENKVLIAAELLEDPEVLKKFCEDLKIPAITGKLPWYKRLNETKWIDAMVNIASNGSLSAEEVKVLIAAELLKDPEVLKKFRKDLKIPDFTDKLPPHLQINLDYLEVLEANHSRN